MLVDRRAQVVHDALADLVHGEPHHALHVERVRAQHALRGRDDRLLRVLVAEGFAVVRVDLAEVNGRVFVNNVSLGREMGMLDVPISSVIDIDEVPKYAPGEVCIICTGSQGEPMAALSRMANGDHQIRVGEGDTVILASSLIPGNENSVYRFIKVKPKVLPTPIVERT